MVCSFLKSRKFCIMIVIVTVSQDVCATNSTSCTDVSKGLSSFYKAIFTMVNDLWVSNLRKFLLMVGFAITLHQ
jgi:hypothetical protein